MKASLMSQLSAATQGLLYPSETDAPIVPFCERRRKGDTPQEVAVRGSEQRSPVELMSVGEFFHPLLATPDGERFGALKAFLEDRLEEPRVVRVGSPRVTIYVIGGHGNHWAGVWTVSVET